MPGTVRSDEPMPGDDELTRLQRRDAWGALPLAAFAIGLVLLRDGSSPWHGFLFWWLIGCLVLGLAGAAVARRSPRVRARRRESLRVTYAVRRHIDPGPELRGRADRLARQWAGNGWILWFAPLIPLSAALVADWRQPVASTTGAVLAAAGTAAGMVWWQRVLGAARRWTADPPGPSRPAPPDRPRDRWSRGSRLVIASAALGLVVGVVIVLVAVVLD